LEARGRDGKDAEGQLENAQKERGGREVIGGEGIVVRRLVGNAHMRRE